MFQSYLNATEEDAIAPKALGLVKINVKILIRRYWWIENKNSRVSSFFLVILIFIFSETKFSETKTETFFFRPNFPKLKLFSETETETFFPRPNFPKPKPRLDICRDCRDRRSCKIFVSCVIFSRKQRSFLHILQVYTHLNVNFLHNC